MPAYSTSDLLKLIGEASHKANLNPEVPQDLKRLHRAINEGREPADRIGDSYIYKKIYSRRKQVEIILDTRLLDIIANYVGYDTFSQFQASRGQEEADIPSGIQPSHPLSLSSQAQSIIESIFQALRRAGFDNPVTIAEQVGYLLLLQSIDPKYLELNPQRKVELSEYSFHDLSRLKQGPGLVGKELFPQLSQREETSDLHPHLENAVWLITDRGAFDTAVQQLHALYELLTEETTDYLPLSMLYGKAWDYLLDKVFETGQVGYIPAHRHIRDLMCRLVDWKPNAHVLDPACGVGGFLAAAYRAHATHQLSRDILGLNTDGLPEGYPAPAQLSPLSLQGFDLNTSMLRLFAMQAWLMEITPFPTLHQGNVFHHSSSEVMKAPADVVISNPPFGSQKELREQDTSLAIQSDRIEINMIWRALDWLKEGGEALFIVPEGLLYQSQRDYQALRQHLLEQHSIEAIISLPKGVFRPFASTKTSILKVRKRGRTERIWYYELEHDGYSLDDYRKPLDEKTLPHLLNAYHNREKHTTEDARSRHFWVPVSKLDSEGYALHYGRYHTQEYVPEAYTPSAELMARVLEAEQELQGHLDTLQTLLADD